MGAAPQMQRIQIDHQELRAYLLNAILFAGTLGIITFMCCAFTVTWEVNAIRVAQDQAITDTQHGLFSRMDSLLSKLDTFLVSFGSTNESVARELMQVRVQVRQSQEAQTQQTKAMSQVATNVAKESLKVTESIAEAVADTPAAAPPVVEVKQPPAAVNVEAPPPVVQREREEPQPAAPVDEPPRKRRWYRHLWPFS